MISYQVVIEPHIDTRGSSPVTCFRARCPSVPEAVHLGDGPDDALDGLAGALRWALINLYLTGKRMPIQEPVEYGAISITAPFIWLSALDVPLLAEPSLIT